MLLRVRVADGEIEFCEAEEGGRGQTVKHFVYHNEDVKHCTERESHALEIFVTKRT